MVTCVAFNCKNRSRKSGSNPGISFHKFPKDNRRKIWAKKVRRKNWIPTDASALCSRHFTSDSFDVTSKYGQLKILKKDAIPTIFDFTTGPTKKREPRKPPKIRAVEINPSTVSVVPEKPQVEMSQQNLPNIKSTVSKVPAKPRISPEEHRIRVFLDHNYGLPDSMTLKRRLETAMRENELLKKKQKESQKLLVSETRKRKTIQTAYTKLKKSNLEFSVNPVIGQLLLRMQEKEKFHHDYPKELKAFAIELQSNSNGAYELVRKTFGNALPHLATIRKWLAANLELSSKAILNALDAELPHDQMSSLGNTNQ